MAASSLSHDDFWDKARRWVGKVPFVKDMVAMYFAMLDPATPILAKATIGAALIYFVVPFDAIPDALGPLGFVDDAAAVSTALAAVNTHVTSAHYARADEILE